MLKWLLNLKKAKFVLKVDLNSSLILVRFSFICLQGNRFFKDGEYQQAIECYSAAINLDSTNHLLYGNRSQAYLNLNM